MGEKPLREPPRDIIQYLFTHDKALEIADSISSRGYFPNEPLLALRENSRIVVVEGNRRLAALKALREPGLLEGSLQRQIERLSRRIVDRDIISTVPVTMAPSRRDTDRLLAGRHIGTPVLPWQAENRASFILDKISEGYDNNELRDALGFTSSDIQKARQTRAIADMARSLDLPDEIKAKLDNPRAKIFTTIERVFDSPSGRKYLRVERDPEHGIRGTTTKSEFVRGFRRLVSDIAIGDASSRTLNKPDDIEAYFKKWNGEDLPANKRGSFVPADVISGKSVASARESSQDESIPKRNKSISKTILPKDFRPKHADDRLLDIRRELTKLKRDDFPNAGAVLLRVFFELSAIHYLTRTGDIDRMANRVGGKQNFFHGAPTMKQIVPELTRIAKEKLPSGLAIKVEKALRYDAAAPFTISDMHAFVHQSSDLPSARDLWQFWLRTEPLFRLMLEQD